MLPAAFLLKYLSVSLSPLVFWSTQIKLQQIFQRERERTQIITTGFTN